jgi:quaternary ammonium compound-resistance protein SugE
MISGKELALAFSVPPGYVHNNKRNTVGLTPIARTVPRPEARPVDRGPRPSTMEVLMAWALLVAAGVLEIGWAIGLKYTDGFTRLWPSVWTIAAMVVSMYLLALAARTLPIGTAYAVWVGIGAAGAMILGMALLGEPRTIGRIACVGLIVAGVIGLKLIEPT